jgi:parallel beta-helix repeat protein
VLRGGTYHEYFIVPPGKNITVQSYPGEAVWFDGSTTVSTWVKQGSTWVSNNWTAQFDHSASFSKGSDAGNFVNSTYPMAAYPDQMFVDGRQLDQVASSVVPGPGQFAVDYAAKTLTMGSDPTGHEVRASDLAQAFVVAGRVTLRGLGVHRYATSLPQIGTVYFGGTPGFDVAENVVIADNATQGLSMGTHDVVVSHVTAINNGMTGIHSNNGTGGVVADSLITGNNTQHFNPAPSAGGMKITRATKFTIRNNDVLNNVGVNGIWLDVSVSHFSIVGNTVAGNSSVYAILAELSDTGIIANNTVSGSTRGVTAFDTGNVRIFNNTFTSSTVWDVGVWQDSRRNTGANADTIPWISRNITVSNNLMMSTGALYQFYALDKATRTPASAMNLVVDGNLFTTADSGRQPIMVGWGGGDNVTVTQYRTAAAINAGLGNQWHNAQTVNSVAVATALSSSGMAIPLPVDIAAEIGRPAGTRHLGAF